jgi:uncharacterized protein YjaZ
MVMLLRKLVQAFIFMGMLHLHNGCSDDGGTQACGSASALVYGNAVCLSFENARLSAAQKKTIEEKTIEGLQEINKRLPVDNLQIRIVDDANLVIPEIGMGGFNPNPNEVLISIDASYESIKTSLGVNFIPQLAHEIHHAKRRRSVGYGNTLFQAVVSEGLADHFSIEIAGINPPPWSLALQNDDLPAWIETAGMSWDEPSYDHDAWFVGTDPEIPRWAGYAIGFELVKNYLSQHPGALASTLWDEPATSFMP